MDKCKNGHHTLEEIYTHHLPFDEELVIRWCSYCGAIVIDQDTDGRTNPGGYKQMRFPEIVKQLVKK